VVVFAHGSGSGRAGPRNRLVADAVTGAGLAAPVGQPAALDALLGQR
jgi:hypothetical protein